MKTIALFGATGRTGKPFLKYGLDKYKLKALVRNPERLEVKHSNLEIIKGDITNQADITKTIAGADIVVSLIGHVNGSEAGFQTEAIKRVISIMKELKINRLISLTGGGVRDKENDQPGFMDRLIVFIMKNLAGKGAKNALEDGQNHSEVIKQSNLDWTIVRGPMLTEEPAKGHIEVGYVGKVPGFKLTREDLAKFILDELENNEYIHKMPFLTNGK